MAIFVANWPATRAAAWRTLLQARAIENQCYVAGINRSGADGNGHAYSGDSLIVDFAGTVLADAKSTGLPSTLKAVAVREELSAFRARLPFSRRRRPLYPGVSQRRMRSSARPRANSSTSLSRMRTFRVKGFLDVFDAIAANAPGHLVGIPRARWPPQKTPETGWRVQSVPQFPRPRKPVSQVNTACNSSRVRPFFFHLGHIMGVDRSKGHPRNVPVMGFGGLHDKKTEGSAPYLNAFSPVTSKPVMSRWMSCVPS